MPPSPAKRSSAVATALLALDQLDEGNADERTEESGEWIHIKEEQDHVDADGESTDAVGELPKLKNSKQYLKVQNDNNNDNDDDADDDDNGGKLPQQKRQSVTALETADAAVEEACFDEATEASFGVQLPFEVEDSTTCDPVG